MALGPALVVAILSASCSDDVTAPTQGTPLQSVVPAAVQPPVSQRLLVQHLARALRDPEARQSLYDDLQSSPVKEGKLHFRSYLQASGNALGRAMEGAGGRGPGVIAELLDQAVDLELYMPVSEHRAQWQGGTDLLVATQREDDEIPYGVDLTGREVTLSLDQPPSARFASRPPVPFTITSNITCSQLALEGQHFSEDNRLTQPWQRGGRLIVH